jgi:hypothetical protein
MREFIGIIALPVLFLWFVFFYIGWMPNYSEGQRTGDVYKFSKKGVFYKSWEGEMYLGGYHSTGGKTPTIETDRFYFSLEENASPELIEKLKSCSEKRNGCTLLYREWLKSPIYLSTSYVIVDVIEK